MRTPLIVVTGVDETAMDSALMSLSWDLANAVVVRHRIDPRKQVLSRVVSDATGLIEHETTALDHACTSCALREDVLPTLERLAREHRWSAIVVGLPISMEAQQVTRAVSRDRRLARRLRLAQLVSAVAAADVVDTLLCDTALAERGLHTGPDDDRGVGEVACAQVEACDLVVLDGDPGPEGLDLVRALARPTAHVASGADSLDPTALLAGRHTPAAAEAWSFPIDETPLAPLTGSLAWRLDLCSPRPFHPERLLENVESLGAGPHRSRGCFWVPTRPGALQHWAGAGGQLSIGTTGRWGARTPLTRIVLTGLGPTPSDLPRAFEDLLLTPQEGLEDQRTWAVVEDGLEPWLGDVLDAA